MVNRLDEEIEIKREEMLKAAREFGIKSRETIKLSIELDKLINEYQKKLL